MLIVNRTGDSQRRDHWEEDKLQVYAFIHTQFTGEVCGLVFMLREWRQDLTMPRNLCDLCSCFICVCVCVCVRACGKRERDRSCFVKKKSVASERNKRRTLEEANKS